MKMLRKVVNIRGKKSTTEQAPDLYWKSARIKSEKLHLTEIL